MARLDDDGPDELLLVAAVTDAEKAWEIKLQRRRPHPPPSPIGGAAPQNEQHAIAVWSEPNWAAHGAGGSNLLQKQPSGRLIGNGSGGGGRYRGEELRRDEHVRGHDGNGGADAGAGAGAGAGAAAVTVWSGLTRFKECQEAALMALRPSDYMTLNGRKFIKKTGWRKMAFLFNISFEIKDKKIELDVNANVLRAEFVVRARMGSGRFSESWGSCDRRERKFTKGNHDIPSTAETRAKTRACEDLLGIGD